MNGGNPTWEDYKKVEKELDEIYIEYATATTASKRILCACAIEEYHRSLSIMRTLLDPKKVEVVKFGYCI